MADIGVSTGLKLINQRYVFYRRLAENQSPELQTLGKNVERRFNDIMAPSIPTTLFNNLYKMAAVESEKEIRFLKQIFGKEIEFDPMNDNFYNELTEAINLNMGVASVYRRNKDRILAGETQISIAQLFPSYFGTAWSNNSARICKTILDKWSANKSAGLIDVCQEVMDIEIPKLIDKAITAMLKSKDFKGGAEDKRAYKEFLDAYKKFGRSNSDFAKEMRQIYGLDEITAELAKSLTEDPTKKITRTALGAKTFEKNHYQRGGISQEALQKFLIDSINDAQGNGGHVIRTGGVGEMKADNITLFEIDPQVVEDTIKPLLSSEVSREKNVEIIKKLGEKLKDFTDGFIVYTNTKNYSLTKDFESHGFHSGQDISLKTFDKLVRDVQPNNEVFLDAIANTSAGAYFDDPDQRERLEMIIATDIAYLLFDDVKALGLPEDGAQSLHIFDLDGIYIPLSYLLFKLAKSIQMGLNDQFRLKRLVNTHIKYSNGADKILYEEDEDKMWPTKWNEQRDFNQANIKIGAYFLSNLRDIIASLEK